MLIVAAILTVAVGLMHSVLGGRYLIAPILKMDGLPVILGSRSRTRLTLKAGWHAASLTWWGLAGVLVHMQVMPGGTDAAFLTMVSAVFGLAGLAALILSRGTHLSWVFFLPVALITGYSAALS